MALSWIAVDWGTTNLRCWAIGAGDAVLAEARSEKGMNALGREEFEPALLELVEGWLPEGRTVLALACGTVGARQGWVEAPYTWLPAAPLAAPHFRKAPVKDPRLNVFIIPGMARRDPADVLRGEETQIAGLLAERPGFEGTVCLPGTHSKWAKVEGGQVRDFTTYITGELFSLLERRSILRHSMNLAGFDQNVFKATVTEALAVPDAMMASLFSIRAEDLTQGLSPAAARARLSAYVIAAELRAARKHWQGREVFLLASGEIATLYETALTGAGADARVIDSTPLTLLGLTAARALLGEMGNA